MPFGNGDRARTMDVVVVRRCDDELAIDKATVRRGVEAAVGTKAQLMDVVIVLVGAEYCCKAPNPCLGHFKVKTTDDVR